MYNSVQHKFIYSTNIHKTVTMSQASGLMREKTRLGLYTEEVTVYWKSQPRNRQLKLREKCDKYFHIAGDDSR